MSGQPLVELTEVTRTFGAGRQMISAVRGVTIGLMPGQVLCLVGESGSGKTTVGRLLAGLLMPTTGHVSHLGTPLPQLRRAARRRFRLAVQLIHQDPYASLNPSQRIGDMLRAPLRRHRIVGKRQMAARIGQLLASVELAPAADIAAKFPHQLSGGQRQRAAIARSLTVNPSVLVADEAVSMVDVSLRVSILNTLRRLVDDAGLAVLFITHDLALARHFGRGGSLAVMYLGQIVESGPVDDVIDHPQHPYTIALLAAASSDPRRKATSIPPQVANGEVPSLSRIPTGCAFHPRCPKAVPGLCDISAPPARGLTTAHLSLCHLAPEHEAHPTSEAMSVPSTPSGAGA